MNRPEVVSVLSIRYVSDSLFCSNTYTILCSFYSWTCLPVGYLVLATVFTFASRLIAVSRKLV